MDDYVAQGRADSFPGFRDSLYAWTREYFNMRLAESELRDDELILGKFLLISNFFYFL